jgi:hypothetical protein
MRVADATHISTSVITLISPSSWDRVKGRWRW